MVKCLSRRTKTKIRDKAEASLICSGWKRNLLLLEQEILYKKPLHCTIFYFHGNTEIIDVLVCITLATLATSLI